MLVKAIIQNSFCFSIVFGCTGFTFEFIDDKGVFFKDFSPVFEREHLSYCHGRLECKVKLDLRKVLVYEAFQTHCVIFALFVDVRQLQVTLEATYYVLNI